MTRDELILNNLGLVGSCATRFLGKGYDYEDLYSAGCIGLIKAADRFDESLGFAFSTYAVPSILGEIRRIFRDGGTIKVSRSLKEKIRTLTLVTEQFKKEYGTEPTISELSKRMNLSVAETTQLFCASQPVMSLTADDDNEKQIEIPTEDEYTPIDNRLAVTKIINELPPADQALIKLRFYDELTQSKTAQVLGISQVQVSRREKIILSRMREKLIS